MVRLSKKIPPDLNELETGFDNPASLITFLRSSSSIETIKDDLYKTIPGLPNSIDSWVRAFFMPNSWQLTKIGLVVLYKSFKSYRSINESNSLITGRVLINMSKILNSPWHVHGRYVYVFDIGSHFELEMFDGDVRGFVDFHVSK